MQINGRVRARVQVPTGADAETIEAVARADERVAALLEKSEVSRVITVPDRLINFVLV